MAKQILIKPLITEKGEHLSEELNRYGFVVNKTANKIEIKKAVEEKYGVSVVSVNTVIMPAKAKTRYTKAGLIKGRSSAFKKAYVKVDGEDTIDFFGDI